MIQYFGFPVQNVEHCDIHDISEEFCEEVDD